MLNAEYHLRVRYAETDKMGYVYYGNYAIYFEVARVELLRENGITYKSIEDSGFIMPVLEFKIKYFKPAYYDDALVIRSAVQLIGDTRLQFTHQTYNAANVLINSGEVTLVNVDSRNGKPAKIAQSILQLFVQ
ncbi:MAG: acyl-CoA thioesterase [Bacteroidetes bacterium]|nr:acyl-CoA thioesterase [Bacteroidota bacterium]